ncbi:hypothetical protein T10_3442 [Trichinella papuae]|uniref:Uncharacterized protein n=1 Tax=Trichinella papuae TaxID=268474 RepID=A0A0V1N0W5_9BILA|nr:hypothetical protein T10_3442 [Trichinella papuae]
MPVYEFGSFLFLKPNAALIHQLFERLLKKYGPFRKCPIFTTLIRQISQLKKGSTLGLCFHLGKRASRVALETSMK